MLCINWHKNNTNMSNKKIAKSLTYGNLSGGHWIATAVFSALYSVKGVNWIHRSVVLFQSDSVKFRYINKASLGSVWPMWLGSWPLNQSDSIGLFMTGGQQQYRGLSHHNLISFPQPYQPNQWFVGFIDPCTALAQLTLLLKKQVIWSNVPLGPVWTENGKEEGGEIYIWEELKS